MKFAFNTILEFNDYFKDEATCYQWFEQVRWNGVPVCPHCGSEKFYKVKARGKFQDIPSYRCGNRACDLPFTVRTKSIFEGSKVELRKWFLAAYELSTDKKGISSIELGVKIGVSQKTAWFINHRLRAMLKETEPTLLEDIVQVDESYVGGKNKNRHIEKKQPHNQGRGGKGKTMVFGAIGGLSKQVKARVIRDADRATLFPIINEWIKKDSIMVSDEWSGYYTLGDQQYHHVTVNHSIHNWANGAFDTNSIENFWSIFKRGIFGVFHSVSPQHLQSYLDEFTVRYNAKHKTNIERFKSMVEKSPNARLKYWQATGKKGTTERFLKYKNDIPL